ncbi:hypothetical protein [Clostridium omnivorum]|uniref:Uncharacterized protein n=1 Tax=Clostridium omnivorum TaxID=1604902 RepID=A0ABQ5N239_9CLOT|nr:hypothetical protein [Clostridium sp. E14]GLC29246.1 hypothetical protein bsdE14_06560 [Clostridium sp. E14]
MGRRKLIQEYYADLNNLVLLLNSLTNSYRLLIGGADELNKIAIAKKKDVKEAIERAEEVGEIIDRIIIVLDSAACTYTDYCNVKAEVIKCKLEAKHILTEIDEELKLED